MSEQTKTIKEIEKLQKDFQENAAAVFSKFTQQLFAAVPELESIAWNQWIPGFNDGEPCEFTRGDPKYSFSIDIYGENSCDDCEETCNSCEKEEEDGAQGHEEYDIRESKLSDKAKKAIKEFDDGFSSFDCVLEDVFNANSTITINRNGKATVEDFDCGY